MEITGLKNLQMLQKIHAYHPQHRVEWVRGHTAMAHSLLREKTEFDIYLE